MKDEELKIGEKVLVESRYHGYSVQTVERFTKTTAILTDGAKLKLPFRDYCTSMGSNGFGAPRYRYYNSEAAQLMRKQNAFRKISKVDWSKIDVAIIERCLTLLT